jgi:hypothetical protein
MNVLREIRRIDSTTIEIRLPAEFVKKEVEIIVFPVEKSEPKHLTQPDLQLTSYKCFGKKKNFSRIDAYNDGI